MISIRRGEARPVAQTLSLWGVPQRTGLAHSAPLTFRYLYITITKFMYPKSASRNFMSRRPPSPPPLSQSHPPFEISRFSGNSRTSSTPKTPKFHPENTVFQPYFLANSNRISALHSIVLGIPCSFINLQKTQCCFLRHFIAKSSHYTGPAHPPAPAQPPNFAPVPCHSGLSLNHPSLSFTRAVVLTLAGRSRMNLISFHSRVN
jgi:hypothetical protein